MTEPGPNIYYICSINPRTYEILLSISTSRVMLDSLEAQTMPLLYERSFLKISKTQTLKQKPKKWLFYRSSSFNLISLITDIDYPKKLAFQLMRTLARSIEMIQNYEVLSRTEIEREIGYKTKLQMMAWNDFTNHTHESSTNTVVIKDRLCVNTFGFNLNTQSYMEDQSPSFLHNRKMMLARFSEFSDVPTNEDSQGTTQFIDDLKVQIKEMLLYLVAG